MCLRIFKKFYPIFNFSEDSEEKEGKTAMTEILTPLKCEEPVDVVFMVDGSDSVTARDWPIVLEVISIMKI